MELSQLLDAGVGTIALIVLFYFVWSNKQTSKDMLATVKVLADASAANSAEAAAALKQAEAAMEKAGATAEGLEKIGVRIENASARQTEELIKQTAALGGLNDSLKTTVQGVSDGAVAVVAAQISAHDGDMKAAITRIETAIVDLRDEFRAGHKAQRAEVLGKLDTVLAELASLKPVPPNPPPPVALRLDVTNSAQAGEAEEKAA